VTSADHADIDLDLYMAKRHARYFEKLFHVETSFAAARPAAIERKKQLQGRI
jgi:hypothetical protein